MAGNDTSAIAIRVMTTNVLSPDHAGWARRRAVLPAEFAGDFDAADATNAGRFARHRT